MLNFQCCCLCWSEDIYLLFYNLYECTFKNNCFLYSQFRPQEISWNLTAYNATMIALSYTGKISVLESIFPFVFFFFFFLHLFFNCTIAFCPAKLHYRNLQITSNTRSADTCWNLNLSLCSSKINFSPRISQTNFSY